MTLKMTDDSRIDHETREALEAACNFNFADVLPRLIDLLERRKLIAQFFGPASISTANIKFYNHAIMQLLGIPGGPGSKV